MRLVSLRLRGFKGLRAGIGLEEVFVDFSKLPGGLIAIVGANGSGKTTILDNCHPYRLMPYKCRKAKDWTPGSFSFYDQCFGSDAMKELVFEMGGTTFKSVVLIDVPRRKQEAYLYRDDNAAGWYPLNDGKTKTYDEAVERVVGSPSLFFTSVFRSQGAKNLSDYSRGDIMGIISELLNVDHIKEQSEKARKVVGALSAVVSAEQSKLDLLQEDLQRVGDLSAQVDAATRQVDALQAELNVSVEQIMELETEAIDVQKLQAAQDADRARLEYLNNACGVERQALEDLDAERRKELARVKEEYGDVADRMRDEIASLNVDVAAVERRLSERMVSYGQSRETLLAKISRAEKIVSGADDIRSRVAVEHDAQLALANTREQLAEFEDRRRDLDGVISGLAVQETKFAQSLAHAQKDASKLSGLDCRGDGSGWLNPGCRFISDAVVSREAVPGIETDLASVRESLADKRQTLASCQSLVDSAKASIADLETRLVELARWTKLLPELEAAEANLVQWRADLADMDSSLDDDIRRMKGERAGMEDRLSSLKQSLAEMVDKRNTRAEEVEGSFAQKVAVIKSRLAEFEARVAAFPAFDDLGSLLAVIESKSETVRGIIERLEASVRSREIEIGTLRGQLVALDERRSEAAGIQEKIGRYNAEIAHWALLEKACGNSGIIALEIDDAGPSIAATTNDLLNACYGPRFAVRLETQAEKQDGAMKEIFDISVFDAEIDDVRSISEMSGGQVTTIEDAVTRAICLFNIHRSDRVFESIFSDEKDGALDAEKKLEFVSVKRRAMELGSHSQEFFISQSPELQELADARIVLNNGSVEVAV